MGKELPERREHIVKVIKQLTKQYGYPPSALEIAEEVGLGVSTVWFHIRRLRDEGRVTYEPHQARTLKVIK